MRCCWHALTAVALLTVLPAQAHLRDGVTAVDVEPLMAVTALTSTVPFITTPVVVDGSDQEWAARDMGLAMALDGSNLAYGDWHGPEDLSGDLRMAWDQDQLYFFARVHDDKLATTSAQVLYPWRGDGVQFAFDTFMNASQEMNGGRVYDDLSFDLQETPDGLRLLQRLWSGSTRVLDAPVAVRRKKGERSYEWAIPWSDLAPMSPDFLQQAGFGFSLRDSDPGDKDAAMAWTTGQIDGAPKPRYGRLQFESATEPAAAFLALPPEWNTVDRGNRFLHFPGVDANGTAILLVHTPTPRLVNAEIHVLRGGDTLRTRRHIGRIRSRPLAMVWDLTRIMADLPDGSYTLVYHLLVPEAEPVKLPLHYSKRLLSTELPSSAESVEANSKGPATRGPIAHWSFDDCAPTDISGNGHDGVLFGSPLCVDGATAGSRALRFSPETLSYALVPQDIRHGEQFSVSTWVRLEDSANLGWQFIISRMETATALRDGAWGLRLNRGRVFFLREFHCCVEDDRWTMITVTGSGTQGQVYIDGQLVLSGELTRGPQQDDLPVCIGCSQGNSLPPFQFLAGAVDDLRVYDRALPAGEVAELYEGHR